MLAGFAKDSCLGEGVGYVTGCQMGGERCVDGGGRDLVVYVVVVGGMWDGAGRSGGGWWRWWPWCWCEDHSGSALTRSCDGWSV